MPTLFSLCAEYVRQLEVIAKRKGIVVNASARRLRAPFRRRMGLFRGPITRARALLLAGRVPARGREGARATPANVASLIALARAIDIATIIPSGTNIYQRSSAFISGPKLFELK